MKNLFYVMLFISATVLIACNGDNTSRKGHNNANDEHEHNMSNEEIPVLKAEIETDSLFQVHTDAITHFYTHMQTALAGDNPADASSRAKQLASHIEQYNRVQFSDKEQEVYSQYKARITELSKAIEITEDIEKQRESFEALSKVMYEFVKAVGTTEPLYKSYCPMAFDGKGAMWLSETEDIANPYYGSSMYRCGSVQEVLKR
ncbi:MAG: DUF3347 domain-containing protein [Flavipsychrobacter sp.]